MDCVFCSIVKGEIPANIVAQNANALAFLDINPFSDGHTVIISKKHYKYLSETPKEVLDDMINLCKEVADIINKSKLKPWGFNYLSNEGAVAGQVVMHVHMHVIPKYGKDEGFRFGEAKHKIIKPVEEVFKIIKKAKGEKVD